MCVHFHREGGGKVSIVKVKAMSVFFTDDELKSAKTLLHTHYRYLSVVQNDVQRKTTKNLSDLRATC